MTYGKSLGRKYLEKFSLEKSQRGYERWAVMG